jgi:hypothetical protein
VAKTGDTQNNPVGANLEAESPRQPLLDAILRIRDLNLYVEALRAFKDGNLNTARSILSKAEKQSKRQGQRFADR